jgi:hypothetical protein
MDMDMVGVADSQEILEVVAEQVAADQPVRSMAATAMVVPDVLTHSRKAQWGN